MIRAAVIGKTGKTKEPNTAHTGNGDGLVGLKLWRQPYDMLMTYPYAAKEGWS